MKKRSLKKINFNKYFLPNLNKARKRLNKSEIISDCFLIPPNMIDYGKNKSYYIRTYGCQSNVRDTEIMQGIVESMGYSQAPDINHADLIILNTCAIRENAEKKVFGEIGFLKKLKTTNPNLIFGIAGCMAQEEKVVNKIISDCPNVDFVMGTHNIYRLPQIIEEVVLSQHPVIEVWSKEGDVIENIPSSRDSKIKAWVNIMYGCDKFCTYCIVPYTRGKVRSRKKEDIINEVNELIQQGYKEITLLGQNVNSYGLDLYTDYKFYNLLEDVSKTNIARIRFATSNPFDWDNKIVDVIKNNKNIMPYIHLPVQSGNENILLKMNRKMSVQNYLNIIKYIRDNIQNVAISTDLIVGFPNETDDEFLDTIKLYEAVEYDNAYTFIYSKRDGTPAALIDDKIDQDTKKKRLTLLNEKVKYFAKKNNEKYVGMILEVLVEGQSKTNKDILTGYSPNWKVVNFNGVANPGDFVKVKITSASRFSLNGEIVNE